MRKLIIILLFSAAWQLASVNNVNADDVKLKMIAANPSETEVKIVPVKFYLPKDIKSEDVTEKGKFEIGYDFERSLYYVYQEVTLEPKETVTLEIGMRDIWVIPAQDIETLRKHTDKILTVLKNTEYYSQANILTESISNRLDTILREQNKSGLTVEQRISLYGVNKATLRDVKKDISVLENLALEVAGASALPVSRLMGESTAADQQVAAENTVRTSEIKGTVKFKIEFFNTSSDKKTMPLKYYLPTEVKPEYVVGKDDLEIAYDYQKGIYYAYKEAVNLESGEKKEFIVEIKDIWRIPDQQIDIFKAHTEKLCGMLSSTEYKDTAKSLNDTIISDLDKIKTDQNDTQANVERHIGKYRLNLEKINEVKKDIAKLEKLVTQMGSSPGVTLIGDAFAGKDSKATKPLLVRQRAEGGVLRGAKGMELVGKSIFRGKAPDVTTSWNIIWMIVGFLAVVSFLFFILWWTQIKKGEKKQREKIS